MGEMVREENPVRPCGVTKAAAIYWPVVVLMAWNNADNDEDHLLQALHPVLLQPFPASKKLFWPKRMVTEPGVGPSTVP